MPAERAGGPRLFHLGAYNPGTLSLIPRPVDGAAKLANCLGQEWMVESDRLGSARFTPAGDVAGCNPCLRRCAAPVPVARTTWSGIKARWAGGP